LVNSFFSTQHFTVVRYDVNRKLTLPRDSSVKFIQIDFKKGDYDKHFGGKSPMVDFIREQTKWDKGRMATNEVTKKFAELVKYNMFTYYKGKYSPRRGSSGHFED